MPVDSQKLLSALLNLDVGKPPSGTPNDFAKYMAANSLGTPSTSPKTLGMSSQANEDTRGVMSKTFGWLASLGNMAENVFLDSAEADDGFGGVKDAARDVGAGIAGFLQPVINAGPLPVPWEDKVSDFVYKYNYQHEGEGPVSGANILERAGVDNPVAKYGGGFAIDVLSDPLTYLGVGLATKGKKAIEVVDDIAAAGGKTTAATGKAYDAVKAGEEAAVKAGLGIPEPKVLPKFDTASIVPGKLTPPELPKSFKGQLQGAPTVAKPVEEITFKGPAMDVLQRLEKEMNFGQREIARKTAGKTTEAVHKEKINPFAVKEAMENVITGLTPRMAASVAPAVGAHADVAVANAERMLRNFGKGWTKAEFNPANQANLYQKMFKDTASFPEISSKFKGRNGTKEALAWRRQTALAMTKAAEDHLARLGVTGSDWAGSGIRFTDVVSELGPKALDEHMTQVIDAFRSKDFSRIKSPEVRAALETAIGRRAAQVGTVSKKLYDEYAKKANAIENLYSPAAYKNWRVEEYKKLRAAMRPMGFTHAEIDKIANIVKAHVDIDDLPNMEPFDVVDTLGSQMAKSILDSGKVDQAAVRKIGKAITRQMGKKPGEISLDLVQNDVGKWFWHNLTTFKGRGFMMPAYRSEISAAQYWAKGRADWIGQMMRGHSAEEIENAFARAQQPMRHVDEAIFDEKTEALARQFTDYMDNLRLQAVNSQMIPQDINKHLKAIGSKFQFDEKGANWIDSWRNVNPKKYQTNPAIFLYNLDLAVQRSQAEYNLLDMFRTEFGKAADEAGFDALRHTHSLGVANHRIPSEVRFDKTVAAEFRKLLADFEKGPWKPSSKTTQMLTQGLRKWKSSITIYYPAHHIRNLIGDSWLMWIAGHNDPRVFGKAQRIIGSQRKRYADAIGNPDFHVMQKFLDPESAGWAQTEGRSIITKKHGANISADEFYGEAVRRGLLVDASRIEDLQGDTIKVFKNQNAKHPVLEKISKPLGGRGHNAASSVAEVREHYVRMAHLVSYAEKHMTRTLGAKLAKETSPVKRAELMKELFDDAAMEIRKYHPDGTDMTFFEQKYLRNIIPFYSWTRKAIPLTMEAMMLRPAKVTAYPRAMYAVQGALGMNAPGGMSDPFPEDQLFPDWMQAAGIGPMGDPESDNPFAKWFGQLGRNQIDPFGNEIGYTIVDPGKGSLPSSMIAELFGMGTGEDVLKGFTDPLTPLINIPADLIRNKTSTGAPVYGESGRGISDYLMQQIPQLSPISRVTRQAGQDNAEGGLNTEAIINMLTALGIQGSGKYTKAAQMQARE